MWCKQPHMVKHICKHRHRFKSIHSRVRYFLWLCTLTFNFHFPVHSYAHTHTLTQQPGAIWQRANPTLCACSFTHCFGPLTGPWHSEPARPPWPPSSIFSSARASDSTSQAQCGFTYCHNDTSHRPTSTLREWVINKPGAICRLSVKSSTPLRYQSSACTEPSFPSFLSSNTNLNRSTLLSSRCHYSKRS